MTQRDVEDLARRIEASATLEGAVATEALAALSGLSPAASGAADLASAESALHLLDRALPGWSIRLDGKALEPNGHWSCQLRSSELRDNDEFIGHGKGPAVANALIAAMLRTLAYLSAR